VLTISNICAADAGIYQVIVGNACGSTTNGAALNMAVSPSLQAEAQSSGTVQFS